MGDLPVQALVPEVPYHMVWLATDACTARCWHCSSNSAKRSPDELDTGEAKALIDELAEAGVVDLGISGGEPLLRRDIMEVMRHARDRGMSFGIASNGAKLAPRRAEELAELGLGRLQVSLDGFAEEHDSLRRWPGLFARVLKTIATARAAGLRVHVCCTITRLSADRLEDFTAFLAETGIRRLNLSRFVPTGRGTAALDPGDAAWRGIIIRCAALKRAYAGRMEITTHLAQEALVDPDVMAMPVFAGCQAGRGQGCVTANGTVLPCVLLPLALGNIRQKGFRRIWAESPVVRELKDRSRLAGACGACGLRERCGGCRALAYARSGNALGEDPRCWTMQERPARLLQ
ncbi:radical SAM/SPASM domain-containing protein [Afifella pfennigii]|uniref:radical SAM/SPASM domain-containing protein n=1 Tax=Afifella pfennigii TaxID=209897 RepID=UPI00047918C2|nr:radical SAM protein [Afifella pfennigii]